MWLRETTREDLNATSSAGLWFGAPAVAFAISTAPPGQCVQALEQLDAAVIRLTRRQLHAVDART